MSAENSVSQSPLNTGATATPKAEVTNSSRPESTSNLSRVAMEAAAPSLDVSIGQTDLAVSKAARTTQAVSRSTSAGRQSSSSSSATATKTGSGRSMPRARRGGHARVADESEQSPAASSRGGRRVAKRRLVESSHSNHAERTGDQHPQPIPHPFTMTTELVGVPGDMSLSSTAIGEAVAPAHLVVTPRSGSSRVHSRHKQPSSPSPHIPLSLQDVEMVEEGDGLVDAAACHSLPGVGPSWDVIDADLSAANPHVHWDASHVPATHSDLPGAATTGDEEDWLPPAHQTMQPQQQHSRGSRKRMPATPTPLMQLDPRWPRPIPFPSNMNTPPMNHRPPGDAIPPGSMPTVPFFYPLAPTPSHGYPHSTEWSEHEIQSLLDALGVFRWGEWDHMRRHPDFARVLGVRSAAELERMAAILTRRMPTMAQPTDAAGVSAESAPTLSRHSPSGKQAGNGCSVDPSTAEDGAESLERSAIRVTNPQPHQQQQSVGHGRKPRREWTDEEFQALQEGLRLYGDRWDRWRLIKNAYPQTLAYRSAVDLKDKARNERKARERVHGKNNLSALEPFHLVTTAGGYGDVRY